jgi:glycosyltransferase involved in cell wall biosynthesis
MWIAFYAPLKPPSHPIPSGDRRMARNLMTALAGAGHEVTLASDLRAYVGDPEDTNAETSLRRAATAEVDRLERAWLQDGAPDLWFCYHPYYKAPDLLGPPLCARFGLPYVTAETSYSARRNLGVWAAMQADVLRGLRGAAVNICLTVRDQAGLLAVAPEARVARLAPFIEIDAPAPSAARAGTHLVTVAMMRPGDKAQSYARLGAALGRLMHLDWHLSVAGDGPAEAEVRGSLAPLGARVRFLGRLDATGVASLLAQGSVFVWPGCGEAYGLGYLEAQAFGLPVVALRVAGVPEVVADGETGLLAEDDAGLAAAVARLLGDPALRATMGAAAAARVRRDHAMASATARLGEILASVAR